MGTALVSCGGGCKCARTRINAHTPDDHTSTLEVKRIALKETPSFSSPADRSGLFSAELRGARRGAPFVTVGRKDGGCLLRLTVLNQTTSAKYRFKLSRLILEGTAPGGDESDSTPHPERSGAPVGVPGGFHVYWSRADY
jgi:hypothetical protein